jgi:hypothetical protein
LTRAADKEMHRPFNVNVTVLAVRHQREGDCH